jgi:D-glycero-alpha-D-manno-heptose-7-phosphate kinase
MPSKLIKCTAPIRICDLGGWTDTWFARYGTVLNIAVFPHVDVIVGVREKRPGEARVTIRAENYKDIYDIDPEDKAWSRHPLIEASFKIFKLPSDLHLDVSIFSDAPVGASTGTSAAVSVALLGALDLVGRHSLTSHEIARKSHYIETKILGYQSGIQDQLSSAYGGINFIEMHNYPEASVSPLYLPNTTQWELESRLLLIYLGRPHSSSDVHKLVIARLEQSPRYRKLLEPLREAAVKAKEALLSGDFNEFGEAMIKNTEAQKQLHPELVGDRARQVIEVARGSIVGYKVNGAGGDGGSLTLLLKSDTRLKHMLIEKIQKLNPDFRNIPIRLAPYGLRRWITSEAKVTMGAE